MEAIVMSVASSMGLEGNAELRVQSSEASPEIVLVPASQIRTGLKALRSGGQAVPERPVRLKDLPLRVVKTPDGFYEVIDGFKRFERWRASNLQNVPVMLETVSGLDQKVALLEANRPPRTLTPMDEARVVYSLRNAEGLGPKGIAHVLGRKTSWVTTRLMMAERLSEAVVRLVDRGDLGVTTAHALCALDESAQEAVCETIAQHGLKQQEALALVSAYHTLEHQDERRALLQAPLDAVRPSHRTATTVSALCSRLEEKLSLVRDALDAVGNFIIPDQGLTSPERRRLEAEHRKVIHQLFITAQALAVEHLGLITEEETNDTRQSTSKRGDEENVETSKTKTLHTGDGRAHRRDCPPSQAGFQCPKDSGENNTGTQGGAGHSCEEGAHRESAASASTAQGGKQARPIQGANQREAGQKPDRLPHPEGDNGAGLQRREEHSCGLHPKEQRRAAAQEARLAALRDRTG
jgi:ParB-like chromosome segregation protein Spo0J